MTSQSEVVTLSADTSSEKLIGCVKWFNTKAGYGFITVTDGLRSGTDIFVHHSSILVENQQYKYLVQGEYVEFKLIKTSSGTHEFQASNVAGIKGGKLMCETRREFKIARNSYKTNNETDGFNAEQEVRPKPVSVPRRTIEKVSNDQQSWNVVEKSSTKRTSGTATGKPRGRPPTKRSTEVSCYPN
jgi:cold shock CspA family protein